MIQIRDLKDNYYLKVESITCIRMVDEQPSSISSERDYKLYISLLCGTFLKLNYDSRAKRADTMHEIFRNIHGAERARKGVENDL